MCETGTGQQVAQLLDDDDDDGGGGDDDFHDLFLPDISACAYQMVPSH
jgi:hypothetical protein